MRLSRRKWIKTAVGLVLPAWVAGGASIIISPPRYNSFGAAYDADVLDWETRVIANGSSISVGTKNIAQSYSTAISSIRSKIKRRNFYGGNNFLAAQVPFINDAGDALDSPVVGAAGTAGSGSDWTYNETGSSGGLKPLTSEAWLKTGLIPSIALTENNCGFSAYVRDAVDSTTIIMGCNVFGGPIAWYFYLPAVDGNDYFNIGASEKGPVADAVKKGFYTLVRPASNSAILYRNATSILTTTTPGAGIPTGPMAIFALLRDTGLASQFSTKTQGGYAIHESLDATEVGILNTAEAALQTSFSRNV